MAGRIFGVAIAVVVVVAMLYVIYRWMNVSFFNGFLVAVGTFLSVDLLLVHWVMELHRITSGPEAVWIEVILFGIGVVFVTLGLRRELFAPAGDRGLAETHSSRRADDSGPVGCGRLMGGQRGAVLADTGRLARRGDR